MKYIFLPAALLIATEWHCIRFDTVLRAADDSMLWAFSIQINVATLHIFSSAHKRNQMIRIEVDLSLSLSFFPFVIVNHFRLDDR